MTGCTLHQKSTLTKVEIVQKVDTLMDEVYTFASKNEKYIQEHGRKLTNNELHYAKSLGVKHPEKVRVFLTSDFPMPTNKEVLKGFKELGFDSMLVGGVTYRYGILIKDSLLMDVLANKEYLLAHELVHVRQVEEAKSYKNFLRSYLIEAFTHEYFEMPYEHEAYKVTENFKGF